MHQKNISKPLMVRPTRLAAMLSISRESLRTIANTDPTFPKKIQISERIYGFSFSAIQQWMIDKEVTNESIS